MQYEHGYEQIKDVINLLEEIQSILRHNLNSNCRIISYFNYLEENPFYFEDLQRVCILISSANAKYLRITQSKSLARELESKFEMRSYVESTKKEIISKVENEFKIFLEGSTKPEFDWSTHENLKRLQLFLENFVYLSATELGNRELTIF